MATIRPISEVLRENSFKVYDLFATALESLAQRVHAAVGQEFNYLPPEFQNANSIREVKTLLDAAAENISNPKIRESKLTQNQLDKIHRLADPLFRRQSSHLGNPAGNFTPFADLSQKENEMLSPEWLRALSLAKLDLPSTAIFEIVSKHKQAFKELIESLQDNLGRFQNHVPSALADFTKNHRFDLSREAFVGHPDFLKLVVLAEKPFLDLYEKLDDKDKKALKEAATRERIKLPLNIKELIKNGLWVPATWATGALGAAFALSWFDPKQRLPEGADVFLVWLLKLAFGGGCYLAATKVADVGRAGIAKVQTAATRLAPSAMQVKLGKLAFSVGAVAIGSYFLPKLPEIPTWMQEYGFSLPEIDPQGWSAFMGMKGAQIAAVGGFYWLTDKTLGWGKQKVTDLAQSINAFNPGNTLSHLIKGTAAVSAVGAAHYFSVPFIGYMPALHSLATYFTIGGIYTAGAWIASDERTGALKEVKDLIDAVTSPVNFCYGKVKTVWNAAKEVKDLTVKTVKKIPVVGSAISGAKWAQVLLITLSAKHVFALSSSSFASFLPGEPTWDATWESLKTAASGIGFTATVLPGYLYTGARWVAPLINPTSVAGALAFNHVYRDEIQASTAKIKKVTNGIIAVGKGMIPSPKAFTNLMPSFVTSYFKKPARIFATPLARGSLPDTCKLLDDPKYSQGVRKAAQFASSVITPVTIFVGACKDLLEKNISNPEESRAALARFCHAKKLGQEQVETWASAMSTAEAVFNWGAKVPGLNIVMGQLRTQAGIITAVSASAIGLSMMVVGDAVTRTAGSALIREFTVQGASNAIRGLVESYFYLLSLFITVPWDLSGNRLSYLGETKPSPLHVPLAVQQIARDVQEKGQLPNLRS